MSKMFQTHGLYSPSTFRFNETIPMVFLKYNLVRRSTVQLMYLPMHSIEHYTYSAAHRQHVWSQIMGIYPLIDNIIKLLVNGLICLNFSFKCYRSQLPKMNDFYSPVSTSVFKSDWQSNYKLCSFCG